MDASQSYLPQPAEAADNKNAASHPVESADEEIIVFANNNKAVPRSSLKSSPPGGAPRVTASSGDDKVSVEKADGGAESDKKSLDVDDTLTSAFKGLKVSTASSGAVKNGDAKKFEPGDVAFPNLHSSTNESRPGPPGSRSHLPQFPSVHAYGDPATSGPYPADRNYHQVGELASNSDWTALHQVKVARKGSDDQALFAQSQLGRPPAGSGGYAGTGSLVPPQYTGGAVGMPGYMGVASYTQHGLHNAYAPHPSQASMYDFGLSPNLSENNQASGTPATRPMHGYHHHRPPAIHTGSPDANGVPGLGMSLGAGAGVPSYSPLPVSPSPMHNPYAQIPQHPMQPYMGQPPTPVQSHGPYPGQLSMRGQVPEGYPGAQAQGAPNANGMPYYGDMYAPAADPALFGRYTNGHGQTAGPPANGPPTAAGAAPPYGVTPTGSYPPHGVINTPMRSIHHSGTPQVDPTGNGPSANNRKLGLYKTELCRSWEEKGSCRYGLKCQFAHGEEEIRKVARHPKYKTEICRTFWVSGSCPYGKRCCFIHTELPVPGAPGNPNPPPGPGVVENRSGDGSGPVTSTTTPNPPTGDSPSAAHTRSTSTASDANEQPSSLLARISAKRGANNENGPSASTTATSIQGPRLSGGATVAGLSHNRHLSSMSDGRPPEPDNSFPSAIRPGHTHSASAHALVSPTFGGSGTTPTRQYPSQSLGGAADVAAATNGGLNASIIWHKRSASGSSANVNWNTAPGSDVTSSETTQPLRSIYSSLTPAA